MRQPFKAAIAAVALSLISAVAVAQQPYHVLNRWKLGGTGGWDYMRADPNAHLLYVTHGTRVEVLDTRTGKSVGAITGLKRTHGVVLPEGRFGYISDGGSNAVVVFDRKTFAKVETIPAGTNPDGMVYEPVTKTVWAFNGRSHNVTVIDTASRTVIATLALPGKPEFPQADGNGNVYDNMESTSSIVRFDAKTRKLTADWTLKGCDSPSGLAIDPEHMRLFSVCDNKKMAVVDARDGKVLALPEIGEEPDAADYDAKDQLAFSSNGSGTLSVINAKASAKYAVIEDLPTQKGARTSTYDPLTDRLYLVTADFGSPSPSMASSPHTREAILDGTFAVLVVGRK